MSDKMSSDLRNRIKELEKQELGYIQSLRELEAENKKLREKALKLSDNCCEGYCLDNGGRGKFDDCFGCEIAAKLLEVEK